MSDFPRGWTLSNVSTGGTASITVAAIAGVVHVLDSLTAKVVNQAGVFVFPAVTLTSSDGVFAALPLAQLGAAATTGTDSASESGLDLAAGPGASLTIAFSAALASLTEFLLVQGHDI